MSLVNQMLRDLEKRRAGERHGSGGIFQGLTSTAEPGRGASPVFVVVALLAVAFGVAAGYLLWERRAPVPEAAAKAPLVASVAPAVPAVAAPVSIAPEPAPAAPAQPQRLSTPVFVPLEPAPERRGQPAGQAAPSAPRGNESASRETPAGGPSRKETRATAHPRPPAKSPVVAAAATAAPSEPAVIEKKPIPPTPQQLAATSYQKGYEALGAGRHDEAERQFREALQNDAAHVAARESLAGMLLAAGRRVEAGEVLDAGLELKPEVVTIRKLKGRLQVEQGDVAGAVATLESGADAAAQDGEYQALLGALYQRQNAFPRSVARYQQALLIDPRQAVWWLGLAISSERGGQKSDALTAYRRALDTGLGDKLASYARERITALEK